MWARGAETRPAGQTDHRLGGTLTGEEEGERRGGMRCGPAEPRPGLRGRWTIASEATWQGRREEGHVGQWRRQPDHFVGGTLAGEEGGGRGIYVKGECGFSG